MSLFSFLNNRRVQGPREATIDSVELAYQLLSTLSIGNEIPEQYKAVVLQELKTCDTKNTGYADRQTLLSRIIELTGAPDTPKQRYLLAKAYSWSHAEYRSKAIEYITLYLDNELFDGAYSKQQISDNPENPLNWVTPKNRHLYEMYSALGDAYLGEHEDKLAFFAYQKASEYAPSFTGPFFGMATACIHMNDLQGALTVFENAKKSPYYTKREWYDTNSGKYRDIDFWKTIDKGEKEIKDKIEKNYVYRPKKERINMGLL